MRIDLPQQERLEYAASADDERYRLAATAPAKLRVVKELVAKHEGERILVIGQYLDQIDELAEALGAPKLTGATPIDERERLYEEFREGRTKVLVVSKVANFSVDLPEATVAIQVSGSFGSRQEEAQRLGRLLRPKESGPARELLHARRARHRRPGLRPEPPALPRRAGLQLHDPRRARPRRLIGAPLLEVVLLVHRVAPAEDRLGHPHRVDRRRARRAPARSARPCMTQNTAAASDPASRSSCSRSSVSPMKSLFESATRVGKPERRRSRRVAGELERVQACSC